MARALRPTPKTCNSKTRQRMPLRPRPAGLGAATQPCVLSRQAPLRQPACASKVFCTVRTPFLLNTYYLHGGEAHGK